MSEDSAFLWPLQPLGVLTGQAEILACSCPPRSSPRSASDGWDLVDKYPRRFASQLRSFPGLVSTISLSFLAAHMDYMPSPPALPHFPIVFPDITSQMTMWTDSLVSGSALEASKLRHPLKESMFQTKRQMVHRRRLLFSL